MLLRDKTPYYVKIVDFGIAKLMSKDDKINQSLTLSGDLVGSPLYMSPEQCKGEELDVRSDIYSLGCLMYHALAGVVPFEGENRSRPWVNTFAIRLRLFLRIQN